MTKARINQLTDSNNTDNRSRAIQKLSASKLRDRVRSYVRKKRHVKNFNGEPQTADSLLTLSNLTQHEKILSAIHKISEDKNGPFIIGPIIYHFTTLNNFRNIIKNNTMLGNQSLQEEKIAFDKNCLDTNENSVDLRNLDGDVICFCPGGFVDHIALTKDRLSLRDGLVRIAFDARNMSIEGKYNMFFKMIDLGLPKAPGSVTFDSVKPVMNIDVKLTKKLSVHFDGYVLFDGGVRIAFTLNQQEEWMVLSRNDILFYGNLQEINQFVLFFPFIALNMCEDKKFVNAVYQELETLSEKSLINALIYMAQNITCYAECNINKKLLMLPNRPIDSIHNVMLQETYRLTQLSTQEYRTGLRQFAHTETPLSTIFSQSKIREKICYIKTPEQKDEPHELILNGHVISRVMYDPLQNSRLFTMVCDLDNLNLANEATLDLTRGYSETRWRGKRFELKKIEQQESAKHSCFRSCFPLFKACFSGTTPSVQPMTLNKDKAKAL